MVWIQFVACLAIIVVAGSKLAKYGDLIAEKTGLGRVWIGVVLLATITSLPELATGISSVTFVAQPDLTMGDLFGSNLINLAIIVIIDLVHTGGPVLHYLGTGIVLSTVLSLSMIAFASTALFLSQDLVTVALFGRIGVYSLALFLLYLVAQFMIFRFHPEEPFAVLTDQPASCKGDGISLRKVLVFFILAAAATIGSGAWLAVIGDEISNLTGLSASFVGTLFLAVCTSAPEIVVSISAVRLGDAHMAVGNVVGSNLFNMGVVVFVDDLFYSAGPVLQGIQVDHIVTGLFAILMSSIVIIGIVFRPRLWLGNWVRFDTAALAILYFGALATLYLVSKPT